MHELIKQKAESVTTNNYKKCTNNVYGNNTYISVAYLLFAKR